MGLKGFWAAGSGFWAKKDIALHDSTWDEGISEGMAAKKIFGCIFGH